MKSIIIKSAAALTVGLLTAASAAFADTAQDNSGDQSGMSKVEHGTAKVEHGTERVAKETWHGSERLARDTAGDSKRIADKTWMETKKAAGTVVHSSAIAYDKITGKPINRTASRTERRRQQIALTGHRTTKRNTDMNPRQQTGSPAAQGKSTPPPI